MLLLLLLLRKSDDEPIGAMDGGAGDGSSTAGDEEEAVAGWCRELDAARADKEYEAADRLRDEIIEAGYTIYGWRQVPVDVSVIGEKLYLRLQVGILPGLCLLNVGLKEVLGPL